MTVLLKDLFTNKFKLYTVLILPSILLYVKTLGFGFSPLDEQWMIVDNARFLSHWTNLQQAFTGPTSLLIYYRPLFVVSTFIDYHFGKLDPFVYHLTNLLLHASCVILLYKFLVQCKTTTHLAFLLSLIFSLHPTLLHAVAWIPGRNDSMLCLFILASLLCLNKFIIERHANSFILHVLFFICALLTKETAVLLPAIFFAFAFFVQKTESKRIWLCLIVWLLITTGWVFLRMSLVSYSPKSELSPGSVFGNFITAFLLNIGQTLLPLNRSVFPAIGISSVIPGLITIVLFAFVWWRFKPANKTYALFGLFLFLTLLVLPLLFTTFISHSEQYQHRLYSPMIGLFLFLSQLNYNLKTSQLTIPIACISAIFAIMTFKSIGVYKNQASYIEAAIKASPDNSFFHMQKGLIFDAKGDYITAVTAFNESIKKDPNNGKAYFNRGNAYLSLGKKEESLADYNTAVNKANSRSKPSFLMQRCIAHNVFEEPELAMNDLKTLKECCANMIEPDFEMEVLLKWKVEQWRRKIKDAPNDASLHIERGFFFLENRLAKQAYADFQIACKLDPGNKEYKELLRRATLELAPTLENKR